MLRWAALLLVMLAAELSLYLVPVTGEGAADEFRGLRSARIIVVYPVLGACWLVGLWWLSRRRGQLSRPELTLVLGGAAVLAVALWGLPATLSDDSYRYRFEGLASVEGHNPYFVKPDCCWKTKFMHPELYKSLDYGWRPTIYPAFAQILFAGNGLAGGTMLGWRIMLLGFELLLAVSCRQELRRRGLPTGWLAGVLLCPLLLIETHLEGHIELVGVALTVAGAVALYSRRWWASAVLLGLAVDIKYAWPALAAFLLLGELYRQRRLLAGSAIFLLTVAVFWLPFIPAGPINPADSRVDREMAGVPEALQPVFQAPREFIESSNPHATVYRWVGMPFPRRSGWPLVIVTGSQLLLLLVLIVRRRWRMELEDICLALGAALLLSPSSYQWYFLWVAPALLAIRPGLWPRPAPPAWAVVWLVLVPVLHEHMAFYFKTGLARPYQLLPKLIIVPMVALLAVAWWTRLREPAPTARRSPSAAIPA